MSKYIETRKNWTILVYIHLAVIIVSDILFYVLSDDKSGLFGWIAGVTSISLLIQVALYKLNPNWFRNKNNSIED